MGGTEDLDLNLDSLNFDELNIQKESDNQKDD